MPSHVLEEPVAEKDRICGAEGALAVAAKTARMTTWSVKMSTMGPISVPEPMMQTPMISTSTRSTAAGAKMAAR